MPVDMRSFTFLKLVLPLKGARGLGVKKTYGNILLEPSWRCRMLNFVENRIENGHSDHAEGPS